LENIAEYIDISTYFTDTGQVNVATKSGISLVNEVSNRLDYRTVESAASLINNIAVNPLQIEVIGQRGDVLSTQDLISAGVEDGVTSELRSGRLEALHQIRDILIPEVLTQLDELAARLRDEMNAIHNDGSGFPAATEFTGTRAFRADDEYDWTGQVQIAVVNEDGTPVRSTYVDESYTGYRPLTLDFEFLDSGFGDGAGVPRMQTIIDEINNHFNAPPIKAVVNNLNNIQMVSNTDRVPNSATPTMDVDFDLENISATDSDFWVTNVQILNDVGVDISSSTDTVPSVAVNVLAGFDFTAGDSFLRVNTDVDHNLEVGDRVFIEDPGTLPAVFASGVASTAILGYVEVTEIVDNNTFIFNTGVNAAATTTEGTGGGAMDVLPPWHEVDAGDKSRARDDGLITLDFTGDVSSTYYDVTFTVGVYAHDEDQVDIAQVTYRVENNQTNLYNDRFDIRSLTGTGEAVIPDTPHQYLIAEMVDEDGNPLQRTNGSYGSQEGYLRLTANPIGTDESFSIVIDELDGSQNGRPYLTPPEEGTERGFSHYFELNNFFTSNIPTDEGDTTDGSAYALAVEERLLDDPSLISTGDLQLSNQPADPDATPLYTYERFESDNSVVQRMASLAFETVSFEAAGGLPNTSLTFTGYTSEILGYQATQAATAESRYEDNDALLQGFVERADTFSGVNLDEELANTIIFQNAYAASARVITVTDEMFETLLGAF
ncbi:MAG: hypothetical protein MRY32_07555, partial [Rickettsiales bacterium]|nr:hypothetical protein [Rickettsiales bacterium]